MTEHPTIRCPTCGKGACDVAPDYDPFADRGDDDLFWSTGLFQCFVSCAAGHQWGESGMFNSEGKTIARSQRPVAWRAP